MKCFIVSFNSTTQAMMLESIASWEGLPGRMIPVPRAITASCGMAWATPEECGKMIRDAIAMHNIRTGPSLTMEYDLRRRHG